ncbi:ATP-binding protein [Desulfogranum marinum]|uniref:sensor histidine kinase n=1 Tax=Desulfogranum marinum TaxID=453220 RepID=UPI0029C8DC60|nr:ATP-binding protein [Desulfogranum marinum]
MKWNNRWLSRLLPFFGDNMANNVVLEKDYANFARSLFILLLVLVLTPLTIISGLSHYQYKQLLQKEELTQLMLNIEQAESTIERFVSKLQSVVRFVGSADRYEELLNPDKLKALFTRLQEEYPDFADIEIIDSQGKQKSYIGPYKLVGYDHTEQQWYQEVLNRGVYISHVFSGYRQVPHFVIAVSRKHLDREGSWVLRVTIDGKILQRYVDTISTTSVADIYMVDADNVAQTQPRKFGKLGQKIRLHVPEKVNYDSSTILPIALSFFDFKHLEKVNYDLSNDFSEHEGIAQKDAKISVLKTEQGTDVLYVDVALKNTPWHLVMVKELYIHGNVWFFFQLRLFFILFSCIIIAVLVILKISTGITAYIREGDRKREHFLAEAESASKLASIGQLAAGVAHEINNPLSIINQKAGLVEDYFEMTGPFQYKKEMQGALDGIQESVLRCKTITHRLLGFARHTDVQTEEIEINVLLKEVVAFLAKEATYNQISIDFDLDDTVQNIFSDRSQLQQVFLNIVNNAVDAIGKNGRILLSSSKIDQDTIKIKITDTGEGMSADVQRRIFDPFFTTKETGKGTGLGLSISYGILKKLGGTIKVQSEIGKGTTFVITLPVTHD